jgi:hypothetical protein
MPPDDAVNTEIEKRLEACRMAVYHARERYGLLIGTYRRVNLLQARFPGKKAYNVTALQPYYDSFDMLVIDLCSAAKAWLEPKGGIFSLLAQNPATLRLRSKDDFGGGHKGEIVARGINKVVARLFPAGSPRADDIVQWRGKFEDATRKVRNDRNKVRAHRYEQVRVTAPLSSYALHLEEYEQHVAYLVAHVHDASLMIKAIDFDTSIVIPESDAADLADLIFHGGIDGALWAYQLVCKAASKEIPQQYEDLRNTALMLLEGDGALYERAFGGGFDE